MKLSKKKNSLSREQAQQIYLDLAKRMNSMLKNTADPKKPGKVAVKPKPASPSAKKVASAYTAPKSESMPETETFESARTNRGPVGAVLFVLLVATMKVALSAIEASGVASVQAAEASFANPKVIAVSAGAPGQFTKEEAKVLVSLDSRRAELEERSKKLDDRENDIAKRDREFATKLTQLRELTEKLNLERDKGDKKHNSQMDQLANVYGSMNPPEAATLIEQLDIQIGLSLLERMPEKRIGQILALMSPERALAITRMLSEKGR